MAEKRKTGRDTPKGISAAAKQKTQSERFIKAAREIGVDETGKEFERALRKIAPAKR